MQESGRHSQLVTWAEVRDDVKNINHTLSEIIDQIDPDPSYKLICATYLYGDLIVEDGVLYIPNKDGEIVSIDKSDLAEQVKQQVSYSKTPLFLTLQNDSEVFLNTGSRNVPLNLYHQGSLLGLFESTDYLFDHSHNPKWSASAGARSILMLPRITDTSGLKRLCLYYQLPSTTQLKLLSDHWHIFSGIAKHDNFSQQWRFKILIFTEPWLQKINSSVAWRGLKNYLFKQAWERAKFPITNIDLKMSWEIFVEAISSRNLRPQPYLADQIKHLLSIATGRLPAFRPATSQTAAPIEGLQQAFVEIYQLRHYAPTILHCYSMQDYLRDSFPVYYSLSFPSILEGSPLSKHSSSIMSDLREISLLMGTLMKYKKRDFIFEDDLFKRVEFDYFHVEKDPYNEIKSSKIITGQDPDFLVDIEKWPNTQFCSTSLFWRGCIRMMYKNQQTTPNKKISQQSYIVAEE